MIGGNGVAIPESWLEGSHWRVSWLLQMVGIQNGGAVKHVPDAWAWFMIGGLLIIAARMPNTQRLMNDFRPALDYVAEVGRTFSWRFRFNATWAAITVFLLVAALTRGEAVSEFLYFQF